MTTMKKIFKILKFHVVNLILEYNCTDSVPHLLYAKVLFQIQKYFLIMVINTPGTFQITWNMFLQIRKKVQRST